MVGADRVGLGLVGRVGDLVAEGAALGFELDAAVAGLASEVLDLLARPVGVNLVSRAVRTVGLVLEPGLGDDAGDLGGGLVVRGEGRVEGEVHKNARR